MDLAPPVPHVHDTNDLNWHCFRLNHSSVSTPPSATVGFQPSLCILWFQQTLEIEDGTAPSQRTKAARPDWSLAVLLAVTPTPFQERERYPYNHRDRCKPPEIP